MDNFIRSLRPSVGFFVRRIYSTIVLSQYKSVFAIANVDNKPAILISTKDWQKIYFPKNLHYHFSSDPTGALLAYKDDRLWLFEERYSNGQLRSQMGFGVPPKIPWQKFII